MANTKSVTIKFNHILRIRKQLEPRAKDIIKKLTSELRTIAVDSFEGSKTGATYGGHQASAEGEPPAIDTAELHDNVTEGTEDDGMTGVVGFIPEYARHLEFGTSKMAPRPFARPALTKMIPRIKSAFNQLAKL